MFKWFYQISIQGYVYIIALDKGKKKVFFKFLIDSNIDSKKPNPAKNSARNYSFLLLSHLSYKGSQEIEWDMDIKSYPIFDRNEKKKKTLLTISEKCVDKKMNELWMNVGLLESIKTTNICFRNQLPSKFNVMWRH